jgi:hypothetical protein
MSLIGLVNLTERLLNQTLGQGQDTQAAGKAATAAPTNNAANAEDLFTPSAHAAQGQNTAQAAGLFQVNQSALFSAAAQLLLTQTNAPAKNAVPVTATQPAVASVAPAATPAAAANVIIRNTPSTLAPATAAPLASTATNPLILNTSTLAPTAAAVAPAATSAAIAPTAASTPAATLTQLQNLNNALAALGIPQSDFARIDQIATFINDFNPVAFSSLLIQLEALAKAVSQQPASAPATAANAAGPAVATPAATNASTTGGANTGGNTGNPANFQISELSIRFTGINETQQTGGNGSGPAAGGSTTTNISAFQLQVEEVNLSLTNNAGQTVQVQAPQPAATASVVSGAPVAAKAQAAGA